MKHLLKHFFKGRPPRVRTGIARRLVLVGPLYVVSSTSTSPYLVLWCQKPISAAWALDGVPSTRTGTDDGNTVCPTTEESLTRQCGKDRSKRKH
jgi:hypothetical protein